MTDFNYIDSNLHITLIPNNDEAVAVWNEIAEYFGGNAKFPFHMKPSIFKQIKDAGYTIRKARKIGDKEFNKILEELEV